MIGQCIMSEMNGNRHRRNAQLQHTHYFLQCSAHPVVKAHGIRAFLNAIVALFRHP